VDRNDYLVCAARLIDEGVRSDLIDRLLGELSLPAILRDDVIQAYREATVVETPLFSDVEETLQALKRHGFLIAVLTDNPPVTQRSKIAHARALDRLDARVYTRECGGEKPRREGFIQAAHSLSLEPKELIMVGDNYFRDGLGAVQAGYMHALIVKRNGAFLNHHSGLINHVTAYTRERIDVVDSLLSVYHACSLS
jgi:HAD superfamily hydrolase (TIGR01549 family)